MGARPQAEVAAVAVSDTVRAAGGIVRRTDEDGGPLVLLVHRPRYDDWSFPKGKTDSGESDEDAARREVEEETGLRCRLGARVGKTRYVDSRGRAKVVRYWMMEVDDVGHVENQVEFVPNAEVDALRWCTPADAAQVLSYDHDRALLDRIEWTT